MRRTTPDRTRAVLDLVFEHRQAQEARYGAENEKCEDGTGPNVRWLLPLHGGPAFQIQQLLREDYEQFEDEAPVTWVHLVREEIAEAFQEDDPERLAEELIQVAALCVSWVERLLPEQAVPRLPQFTMPAGYRPHYRTSMGYPLNDDGGSVVFTVETDGKVVVSHHS